MFEGKAYEWIKENFGEYLFGFNEEQFSLSLLSGIINIKNANIKPDKLNEHFENWNLPFCISAGMIINLNCEVNKL